MYVYSSTKNEVFRGHLRVILQKVSVLDHEDITTLIRNILNIFSFPLYSVPGFDYKLIQLTEPHFPSTTVKKKMPNTHFFHFPILLQVMSWYYTSQIYVRLQEHILELILSESGKSSTASLY